MCHMRVYVCSTHTYTSLRISLASDAASFSLCLRRLWNVHAGRQAYLESRIPGIQLYSLSQTMILLRAHVRGIFPTGTGEPAPASQSHLIAHWNLLHYRNGHVATYCKVWHIQPNHAQMMTVNSD